MPSQAIDSEEVIISQAGDSQGSAVMLPCQQTSFRSFRRKLALTKIFWKKMTTAVSPSPPPVVCAWDEGSYRTCLVIASSVRHHTQRGVSHTSMIVSAPPWLESLHRSYMSVQLPHSFLCSLSSLCEHLIHTPDCCARSRARSMLTIRAPAGEVGNYYYGQGHPMKPHRIRMAHNLIQNYGLYKYMKIYVSEMP